ncbi:uncharacterized protein CTHT_0008460 [Thermochaetoides thermophila DSM 1495]|uniref:Survival Motor Neuron Gemin2-binding domain-containing protein n=1 Tax=Chaetomium thermophilum (strain DSM 1495 / CBS 144.50 / IMI 039719) TaxID=759272 RepID=G0S022_CHATD|nr:hypothetical protein CTHT_0008460 [Thermochaetoides thermophila DSM 1495]EGS23183.1 hypothetical protein CTHT_0008460 [Thermochaetoides thermophila DSM 1495]
MESQEAATHEEIWDDSMLIESWNQALEEYKKYHSIHARGSLEDLEVLECSARPKAKAERSNYKTSDQEKVGEEWKEKGEGQLDEDEPMDEEGVGDSHDDETQQPAASHPVIPDAQGSAADKKEDGPQVSGSTAAAALGPQTLVGTVHDDDLKKLLMSWYYAGYYTGLYEGKQQALRQAEQAPKEAS